MFMEEIELENYKLSSIVPSYQNHHATLILQKVLLSMFDQDQDLDFWYL